MGLVVFDIGGSAVKHGFWHNETLSEQAQFKTPDTLNEMKEQMFEVIETHKNKGVEGVGISSPGAVNVKERRIDGISAVPYLHHFPIFDELESCFGLPVTIENDANCAGISEIELGAGKEAMNAVFIVLGTGVGGSIFINRQIYKGSHLFGGELGLLVNNQETTLSSVGTIVKVANKYNELTGKEVNGKDIFELVEKKDELVIKLLDDMYWAIAHSLYNVQVSMDPELVIIGGGVSAREELPTEIGRRLQELLGKHLVPEIMPEIKRCHYLNDANLVGAAMNFINLKK